MKLTYLFRELESDDDMLQQLGKIIVNPVVSTTAAFLLITGLLLKAVHNEHELMTAARQNVVDNVKLYTDAVSAFRTLYTNEVLSKLDGHDVTVTHQHKDVDNAIPLPATLTSEIGKEINVKTNLYSPYPFPTRDHMSALPDAFAERAWREILADPDTPYYEFEPVGRGTNIRFAVADVMRESCVNCHNNRPDSPKADWVAGDVGGIIEVVLPYAGPAPGLSENLTLTVCSLAAIGVLVLCVAVRNVKLFRRLQYRERVYRRAIAQAGAVPYELDNAIDDYRFVGNNIEDITGYPAYEFSKKRWHEIIQESVHRGEIKGLTRDEAERLARLKQIKEWQTDVRVKCRDGSNRWLSDCAVQVFDDHGRHRGSLGIIQDISDRKFAEQELREQNLIGSWRSKVLELLARRANPLETFNVLLHVDRDLDQDFAAAVMIKDELWKQLPEFAIPSHVDAKVMEGSKECPSITIFDAGTKLNQDAYTKLKCVDVGPGIATCTNAIFYGRQEFVEDFEDEDCHLKVREVALGLGIRSCWSQPIHSDAGEVIGSFALYFFEPRKKEDFMLRVLNEGAHLSGIIMDRLLAMKEQEDHRNTLELKKDELRITRDLYEFAIEVSGQENLKQLLHKIVTWTKLLLKCDHVSLYLSEPGSDALHLRGCASTLSGSPPELLPIEERSIITRAYRTGNPQASGDTANDIEYLEMDPSVKSEMAVPIKGDGYTIGVLNAESSTYDAFNLESQNVLNLIASLAFTVLDKHKAMEKRLRIEAQTWGTIAATIAHRLKNPAFSLQGLIELCRRKAKDADDACSDFERHLTKMAGHVRRISDITVEFLKFSKPPEPCFERVDPLPIISEAVNLSAASENPIITVITTCDDNTPQFLRMDPKMFLSVIEEIIDNAASHVEDGGSIYIAITGPYAKDTAPVRSMNNDYVLITISDDGPGVPPNRKESIFDPYKKGDAREGHFGLGLAIARKFVRAMGGELVEDGPGEHGCGAQFRIAIPFSSEIKGGQS